MHQHALSVIISIVHQSTADDSPRTAVSTFLPMDSKRVIVLVPIGELLFAYETRNVVLVFRARVMVESCLGKSLGSCSETRWMGPFM